MFLHPASNVDVKPSSVHKFRQSGHQLSTAVVVVVGSNCVRTVRISPESESVSVSQGGLEERGPRSRKHEGKLDEGRRPGSMWARQNEMAPVQCVKRSWQHFFFIFILKRNTNETVPRLMCYYKSPIEMKSSKQYGLISSDGTTWPAQLRLDRRPYAVYVCIGMCVCDCAGRDSYKSLSSSTVVMKLHS